MIRNIKISNEDKKSSNKAYKEFVKALRWVIQYNLGSDVPWNAPTVGFPFGDEAEFMVHPPGFDDWLSVSIKAGDKDVKVGSVNTDKEFTQKFVDFINNDVEIKETINSFLGGRTLPESRIVESNRVFDVVVRKNTDPNFGYLYLFWYDEYGILISFTREEGHSEASREFMLQDTVPISSSDPEAIALVDYYNNKEVDPDLSPEGVWTARLVDKLIYAKSMKQWQGEDMNSKESDINYDALYDKYPATQNERHGFYGGMSRIIDTDLLWYQAMDRIVKVTGKSPDEVREWLDSTDGRHFGYLVRDEGFQFAVDFSKFDDVVKKQLANFGKGVSSISGTAESKFMVNGRSGRLVESTDWDKARQMLLDLGFDLEKDFFTLSSSDIVDLNDVAKKVGYKGKGSSAGASPMRQFWYSLHRRK